jgi:hypothetical protein
VKTPGEAAGEILRVTVPANQVQAVRVFVTAEPAAIAAASMPAAFEVRSGDAQARTRTVFLSGAANAR